LKRKLQKERLRESDVPKEVLAVTEQLQKWLEELNVEETRAVCGLDKYRLAPGYEKFLVEPTTWNRWGPERQTQHIKAFREFVPKSYDTYKKPNSAGHKTSPKSSKRRAELPEPELFGDRVAGANPAPVTPLRLSKVGRTSEWQVGLINKEYSYKRHFE